MRLGDVGAQEGVPELAVSELHLEAAAKHTGVIKAHDQCFALICCRESLSTPGGYG